jgi:hypothetical protein
MLADGVCISHQEPSCYKDRAQFARFVLSSCLASESTRLDHLSGAAVAALTAECQGVMRRCKSLLTDDHTNTQIQQTSRCARNLSDTKSKYPLLFSAGLVSSYAMRDVTVISRLRSLQYTLHRSLSQLDSTLSSNTATG